MNDEPNRCAKQIVANSVYSANLLEMGDREYDDEEQTEDNQDTDEVPYHLEDEHQPDNDSDERNDRTDSRPDGFFNHPVNLASSYRTTMFF